MANNRMYLVHKPTGFAFFLGKRMGAEWYNPHECTVDDLNEFFEECYDGGGQDEFCLAMEGSADPSVITKWNWDSNSAWPTKMIIEGDQCPPPSTTD